MKCIGIQHLKSPLKFPNAPSSKSFGIILAYNFNWLGRSSSELGQVSFNLLKKKKKPQVARHFSFQNQQRDQFVTLMERVWIECVSDCLSKNAQDCKLQALNKKKRLGTKKNMNLERYKKFDSPSINEVLLSPHYFPLMLFGLIPSRTSTSFSLLHSTKFGFLTLNSYHKRL